VGEIMYERIQWLVLVLEVLNLTFLIPES